MTPRQRLVAEIWKEATHVIGVRLIELDEKREDCGLAPNEKVEYAILKEEWAKLFTKMLREIQ